MQISQFFQWLISGTYFLIIITAAIIYMFRGNTATNLNVMRLLPRLLVSVLLTIFSTFLIGAVISTGNLLTQTIFGLGEGGELKALGFVNSAVLQAGTVGGGAEFTRLLIETLVIVPMSLFMAGMAVLGLVCQLALIILVTLAPLAFFCLLIDSWRVHFARWLRALLTIAFIPVITALIMKLALSINPLVMSPNSAYGTLMGLVGVFMIVATFWVIFRLAKTGLGAITNSQGLAGEPDRNGCWRHGRAPVQ